MLKVKPITLVPRRYKTKENLDDTLEYIFNFAFSSKSIQASSVNYCKLRFSRPQSWLVFCKHFLLLQETWWWILITNLYSTELYLMMNNEPWELGLFPNLVNLVIMNKSSEKVFYLITVSWRNSEI